MDFWLGRLILREEKGMNEWVCLWVDNVKIRATNLNSGKEKTKEEDKTVRGDEIDFSAQLVITHPKHDRENDFQTNNPYLSCFSFLQVL